MGINSSLNCRTGPWAQPCPASCCHPVGTCPSPPVSSRLLTRCHPPSGCGHLHTCWPASTSLLKSLSTLLPTPPQQETAKKLCSLRRGNSVALLRPPTPPHPPPATHRPVGAQGSHNGWPISPNNSMKAGRALVGHPGWRVLLWGPRKGHSLIRMLSFLCGPWGGGWHWGLGDTKGKPGSLAPLTSPGPGISVLYTE